MDATLAILFTLMVLAPCMLALRGRRLDEAEGEALLRQEELSALPAEEAPKDTVPFPAPVPVGLTEPDVRLTMVVALVQRAENFPANDLLLWDEMSLEQLLERAEQEARVAEAAALRANAAASDAAARAAAMRATAAADAADYAGVVAAAAAEAARNTRATYNEMMTNKAAKEQEQLATQTHAPEYTSRKQAA